MNISDLRDEMLRYSTHWDGLQTRAGRRVEVGRQVRAWLNVIDSLTSKLVNPRKDEERLLRGQIDTLRDDLDEMRRKLKQNSKPPTRDEDIRRNY
jgi:hypothetical protein